MPLSTKNNTDIHSIPYCCLGDNNEAVTMLVGLTLRRVYTFIHFTKVVVYYYNILKDISVNYIYLMTISIRIAQEFNFLFLKRFIDFFLGINSYIKVGRYQKKVIVVQ